MNPSFVIASNYIYLSPFTESFYCYETADDKDFGFGNSGKSLPGLPVELQDYSDAYFQVNHDPK